MLNAILDAKYQVIRRDWQAEKSMSLTGTQLRAARGLINLSVKELAETTGLAVNTIRRAEACNGVAPINVANANLLRTTLENEGVLFIDPDDHGGAGARLSSRMPDPVRRRRRRDDYSRTS